MMIVTYSFSRFCQKVRAKVAKNNEQPTKLKALLKFQSLEYICKYANPVRNFCKHEKVSIPLCGYPQ